MSPGRTPRSDRKPGRPIGPAGSRAPVRGAGRPAVPVQVGKGGHQTIVDTVTGLGYEMVDVERLARGLLRVTIDRVPGRSYTHGPMGEPQPGEFVTVEDCETVTRQLQYALEVDGLAYARLEVSSPGLDRPLKTEADYLRFAGQAVNIVLKVPFEGRKSWQGVLGKAEGEGWSLVVKNGKTEQVLGFTFSEVREARLVPVVDFKGRQSKANKDCGAGTTDDSVAAEAAPQVDGGK